MEKAFPFFSPVSSFYIEIGGDEWRQAEMGGARWTEMDMETGGFVWTGVKEQQPAERDAGGRGPTGVVQVLQNAVVHRVQVLDVEGREGQRAVESLGEETLPGVVTHEHNPLTCRGGEESDVMIRTALILVLILTGQLCP